ENEKVPPSSRSFILMADPLSAQSEWVKREVACWLEMGRAEKMLIIWTGGDIVWDKARKALPGTRRPRSHLCSPVHSKARSACTRICAGPERKCTFLANAR